MKKITPNIGLLNSFIRLTCGFTMLAWGTSKLIRRPYSMTPFFVVLMGAMKVAEGFTRFCPLTFFVEESIEEMANDGMLNEDTSNVDMSNDGMPTKQFDDLVNPS